MQIGKKKKVKFECFHNPQWVALYPSCPGLSGRSWASLCGGGHVFVWKEIGFGSVSRSWGRDSWRVMYVITSVEPPQPQTCFSCCFSSATSWTPVTSLFRQTSYLLVRNFDQFDKLSSASIYHKSHHLFVGFSGEQLRLSVPRSLGVFPDECNWPVKPAMLSSRSHPSRHLEESQWSSSHPTQFFQWKTKPRAIECLV